MPGILAWMLGVVRRVAAGISMFYRLSRLSRFINDGSYVCDLRAGGYLVGGATVGIVSVDIDENLDDKPRLSSSLLIKAGFRWNKWLDFPLSLSSNVGSEGFAVMMSLVSRVLCW